MFEDVEIYSLCTRTESRLKQLGEKFGTKRLYMLALALFMMPLLVLPARLVIRDSCSRWTGET